MNKIKGEDTEIGKDAMLRTVARMLTYSMGTLAAY